MILHGAIVHFQIALLAVFHPMCVPASTAGISMRTLLIKQSWHCALAFVRQLLLWLSHQAKLHVCQCWFIPFFGVFMSQQNGDEHFLTEDAMTHKRIPRMAEIQFQPQLKVAESELSKIRHLDLNG